MNANIRVIYSGYAGNLDCLIKKDTILLTMICAFFNHGIPTSKEAIIDAVVKEILVMVKNKTGW